MTLTQPLQKKYRVIFCTMPLEGNINKKIRENGFEVLNITLNTSTEMREYINTLKAKVVILDGYNFTYDYEKELKKTKAKLFCFDDTFQKHYCDVVLNHSIEAKNSMYKKLVPKSCKILTGDKYTLLRDEFFKIKLKKRDSLKLKGANVLVMFGGSDPKNYTLKTINTLKSLNKEFNVTIITTTSNKNLTHLKEHIKNNQSYNLVINSDKVSKYINKADFAITTSGGTILEIIYMKVPFINIKMVDNQSNIVNFFKKKKLATCLDEFDKTKLKDAILSLEKNYKSSLKLLNKFKFRKYKASKIIEKLI
jgi:UDP-2,4-diacetamido-2,4,6-trideoxy-beta-L-altropyranose hydrolase